eukprot:2421829-Pyramimonas_sp.AAC.2
MHALPTSLCHSLVTAFVGQFSSVNRTGKAYVGFTASDAPVMYRPNISGSLRSLGRNLSRGIQQKREQLQQYNNARYNKGQGGQAGQVGQAGQAGQAGLAGRGVKPEVKEHIKPLNHASVEQFQYELEQDVISTKALRELSRAGVPNSLRSTVWKGNQLALGVAKHGKTLVTSLIQHHPLVLNGSPVYQRIPEGTLPINLLLGYLPSERSKWSEELAAKRAGYAQFCEELLLNPSKALDSTNDGGKSLGEDGQLLRKDVGVGDDPLTLVDNSVWSAFHKVRAVTTGRSLKQG